jgi:response regulator RpfG family c-di-GMP phosphodiesterase
LVDDEAYILSAYMRNLKSKYNILTSSKPEEAIKLFRNSEDPIKVVVSDYKMPGMDGVQFLYLVKNVSPDTVRIILTGYAELKTAIKAVNEGNIFRFLTKPCAVEILGAAIDAGIHQYNLKTVEKDVLDRTLKGIIKLLTDILSAVNPAYFGKALRMRNFSRSIAEILDVERIWDVEIAALLSQIGIITIPNDILDKSFKGASLSEKESIILNSVPGVGESLLKNIPRLEQIAKAIAYQDKRYDGSDVPLENKAGDAIPLIGRILKVAGDYDRLVEGGANNEAAIKALSEKKGCYDPNILVALKSATMGEGRGFVMKSVPIEDLKPGMIVAENIVDQEGSFLLGKGNEITPILLFRFANSMSSKKIEHNVKVFVPINFENK